MKFNPITRRLYTDDLVLLKTLNCPSIPRWEARGDENGGGDRSCTVCTRVVFDSSLRTDESIAGLLTSDPGACVKVRLDQPNVTVIHHEPGA